MNISNELSVGSSFAPADHTEDWVHFPSLSSFGLSTQGMDVSDELSGGPYSAPESYAVESYTEDGVHSPSRPGCGFRPPGVDVDRGLSAGPYSASASYSEDGAHLRSHSSCDLPPQGVDVGDGLFGGPYSAPERCSEEGSQVPSRSSRDLPSQAVDVGHGLSNGPYSAPASFTEDGPHLRWRSSCILPPPGMDSNNGPYSAPASYVEDQAHFPSNFLPSHTSAPSIFEDERWDPVYDTVAAAPSSAVSGWCHITVPSSSPKKAVSTAKLRKASEKRRNKPGRFRCPICKDTFTQKHNLRSMYSPASLHFILQSLTIPRFERSS